ncbi:hypothetical protein PBT90_19725 [Algoriphagus halophytocola]|uniref:Tetratricopeptide repeat protein n=1 Tax=Algoriphagus halophytocola TaxID=2991499 RepID=A0ABY6MDB1_9BACT|nr:MULTISPECIES: hypothetical protein [unclassified Algoriphagus]UZD21747.1 hypothetical protein OM944_13860 [Algoriphagus sp. TR-M5]WBL42959.1 hypothetical protein PBT90_19725 [Algoriphagus sp. TR-M9]
MKKFLLTYFLISALGFIAQGQESIENPEELTFENKSEKALWVEGQEDPYYLFRAVQADEQLSDENWKVLVQDLDKRFNKKGADYKLLRKVFEKSHQRLFQTYEQHSTFNTMLTAGKYDCVSASAALGLLLDRYGFEFDIVETDYHVFIRVNFEGKDIILESTLPVGGMMTAPSEVAEYLESYQPVASATLQAVDKRLGAPKNELWDNAVFRKVNLKQLAGLQYYNDAISLFNQQEYQYASAQLQKALELYNSERIEGLKALAEDQIQYTASSK